MYGIAVQYAMVIGKFRHKGLRRLYEDDDPSGVPAHAIRKIKAILALWSLPTTYRKWRPCPAGSSIRLEVTEKASTASLTGNWRITFRLQGNTVTDVNFEDYH